MVIVVMLWLSAAVLVGFVAVRVTGAERGTPLVQLISFTPYVVGLAAATAAVAAALGQGRPALVSLAAALVLAGLVAPRLVPARRPTGGVPLRVLTANLLYRRGDAAALVAQVKTDDVDVLAVQELTGEALAALDEAGIDGLLPYRSAHPTPSYTGSALFSRHPIEPGPVRVHGCGMVQPSATLSVPGAAPVLIESAHPCAPQPSHVACWGRDLAAQPPAGQALPQILLGDFNATLDHAALRRLLRTGYRDAAAQRGKGLLATWPFAGLPYGVPIPWLTLDHVLVDARIGVLDVGIRSIPRSDHRAVLAELALPAG